MKKSHICKLVGHYQLVVQHHFREGGRLLNLILRQFLTKGIIMTGTNLFQVIVETLRRSLMLYENLVCC